MKYKIPKYQTIAAIIIEKIKNNELPPGSRVPSENEIIRDYGVSNTTARKVLQEIELGGWVVKIQGKGTLVTNFVIGRNASKVLSFTKSMLELGLQPSTRLIESTILEKDVPIVMNGKNVLIKKPVLRINRLRLANDIPMMHEIRYISMNICPLIEKADLETSLYNIYKEECNLTITRIEQELSAIKLDEFYSNLFGTTADIPGIQVNGITYCENDRPLEGEKSIYRGDKYKFLVHAKP
jgi:GntR family transcriptional regulator